MIQTSLDKRIGSVKNQIVATVFANISRLSHGFAIGWTSTSLPLLRSDESPLACGPISADTAAWIGAIVPLGCLNGTLLFGLLSNVIGSKRSIMLSVLPILVHWILMMFAREAWVIVVARFLCGLTGGGAVICLPLFVAEIASDHVRGRLTTVLQLSFYCGIVCGYVACSYLDYDTVPLVLIVPPIMFFAVFVWLPNTPQFLLKCGKPELAEESLRYYRNVSSDASPEQQLQLREELEKFALIAQQNAEMPPVRFADFLRGMLIGPTLLACAQFSGTFTICNYANTIFRASGSDWDPNASAMIMGSIQVLGTIVASLLIDRLGRKVLLLISTAGSACALLVTGTYAYLNALGISVAELNALPVVSLSFFIFISAVGITPVPYVLVAEVLPPKIRRIGATFCVCTVSVYAFIMMLFFPIMLDAFALHGCMWLFACSSTVGFVFTLLVVQETKGRNLDQLHAPPGRAEHELT